MYCDVASYKHVVAVWRTSCIPTAVLKEVKMKEKRLDSTELKNSFLSVAKKKKVVQKGHLIIERTGSNPRVTLLLSASLSPLEDKAICGQCASVCEWHLVSICLVQGLTPELECQHTKLHKSFHFSSFRFPAVQSVSTVFLFSFCLLWPCQYTHPLKRFTHRATQPLLVNSFW